MVIVNIDQAKSQLSKLVELSLCGEEVVIAKDTSLVRLQPVSVEAGKRRGEQLQGRIEQSKDLNSTVVDQEIENIFH